MKDMTNTTTNEKQSQIPDFTMILNILMQFIFYGIGLYFQIKICIACKTEKNKTWQIHISHAVIMSIFFATRIILKVVTVSSPSSTIEVASWICYINYLGMGFGIYSMAANSILVAVMKYIYIVHTWKAKKFGEEKIQKIFMIINFFCPLLLATSNLLLYMVASDFRPALNLESCFNPFREKSARPGYELIANLSDIFVGNGESISLGHLTSKILNILVVFFLASNFGEAFFYFKIFESMKRYVLYISKL